ncbi:sigma-E factor negative regulatory protein [Myxococcota bacterium]|nr:sigma-E factor negative regulatory protein [Myxococcota bacterium]
MDTFFARNRLSAYLDGSLSDGETAEVDAALADDPELRRELEDMRRAVDLLRIHGPAQAPAGFHARVMARVDAEPPPGRVVSLWRRTLGRVPVEALALAAAAVIVVLVIQGRGDEPTPAQVLLPETKDMRQAEVEPPPPPVQAQAPDAAEPQGPTPSATPASADGDLTTASRTQAEPAALPAGKAMNKLDKGASQDASPYYAGWEQQASGVGSGEAVGNTGGAELGQGIDMEGPRSYRISLADPEVLYQLSAVAEKAGGRMTDAEGKNLRPRELGGDDAWVRVHLVVPRSAAALVEGQVGAMGGVPTPPPSSGVLYGSEYAVFVVELAARP